MSGLVMTYKLVYQGNASDLLETSTQPYRASRNAASHYVYEIANDSKPLLKKRVPTRQ